MALPLLKLKLASLIIMFVLAIVFVLNEDSRSVMPGKPKNPGGHGYGRRSRKCIG